MGCDYRLVSTVAVADLPDAAPNTTPPADARLLKAAYQVPGGTGQSMANALSLFFRSNNGSTGTVTWTAWAKDGLSGEYVKVGSGTTTADHVDSAFNIPVAAAVFVQITATVGFAAATTLETRATETIR